MGRRGIGAAGRGNYSGAIEIACNWILQDSQMCVCAGCGMLSRIGDRGLREVQCVASPVDK